MYRRSSRRATFDPAATKIVLVGGDFIGVVHHRIRRQLESKREDGLEVTLFIVDDNCWLSSVSIAGGVRIADLLRRCYWFNATTPTVWLLWRNWLGRCWWRYRSGEGFWNVGHVQDANSKMVLLSSATHNLRSHADIWSGIWYFGFLPTFTTAEIADERSRVVRSLKDHIRKFEAQNDRSNRSTGSALR